MAVFGFRFLKEKKGLPLEGVFDFSGEGGCFGPYLRRGVGVSRRTKCASRRGFHIFFLRFRNVRSAPLGEASRKKTFEEKRDLLLRVFLDSEF